MKKKKVEINPDTVLRRDPEQEFTYIDGEVMMLSLKNGEYYGMDKIGTRIWEILKEQLTFSDLVLKLLNEFNIDKKTCISDTKEYLNKLHEKKLLVIKK